MKRLANHKNSVFSEFHRKLAAERGWNLDQLAEAVRNAEFKAQVGDGKGPAREVGRYYVTALLSGRKPMPYRWKVAVAIALNVDVSEYLKRYDALVGPAAAQRTISAELVLPINAWPHFSWELGSQPSREIAVRLYGLSKTGLQLKFSVLDGQWEPPGGFPGYAELRRQAWDDFAAFFTRMKKESPVPKSVWHVRRILQRGSSEIELEIQHADYQDILVTGTPQGLEHLITIESNKKLSVREWLASHWNPGNPAEPVLPGAHHLVVNLMVLTIDGCIVLSRQGPDNPDSSGSWCPSVSTVMNLKTDVNSRQMPNLARAASRGCKEELGMETDGTNVQWLAVAAGLKFGSFTVFGLLESSWSRAEIEEAVARNTEKARMNPALVCEVVEVDFIEASTREVTRRLKVCDYRPYLELGVALVLWAKDKAQITDGMNDAYVA